MQSQQPQVNSIVITGYSTEADSIRAVRLGVGDYLKKPFPLQVFLESVERVLAKKRAERRSSDQQQNWRRCLSWALNLLASQVQPESLVSAQFARVEELARACGLPDSRAQEVALAFLWSRFDW